MPELLNETLDSLREAPRHLPLSCNGKCVHIGAVYRWARRGTRGVRLESVTIKGTPYSSIEAIRRFRRRIANSTR